MKNLPLKLYSLFAAICLSLFVNYFFAPAESGTSVVQLIAPVQIGNFPANKSVIWPESRQVELTIQGSSIFMSKVALNPPVVRVNLPENPGTKFIARLSAENISLPGTVKLIGIKPAELQFGFDDLVEKVVPVVAPQIGNLSDELKIKKIVVSPANITVRGPAAQLKAMERIESDPINLNELSSDVDLELKLRGIGAGLESNVDRVKARVEIVDYIGEVNLSSIPIEFQIVPENLQKKGISINPKVASINIKIAKKNLKTFQKDKVSLRAVLEDVNQLGGVIDVKVENLPESTLR